MNCQYDGCTVELPARSGRGRPTKYCPTHAAEVKRQKDHERKLAGAKKVINSPRKFYTYKGEGLCRKCSAQIYDVVHVEPPGIRPPTFYSPIAGGEIAFTPLHYKVKERKRKIHRPTICGNCRKRSTAKPGSHYGRSPRDPSLRWTKAPAKCGYDTKVERMTKEFFQDWNHADSQMCSFVEQVLALNLTTEVLYIRERNAR